MKRWIAALLVIVLLAPMGIVSAAPAPGTGSLVRPTTVSFSPVADTFISGYAPNEDHGSEGTFYLRSGGVEKGLLRFDLSSLPEGSNVLKAWLSISARATERLLAVLVPDWTQTDLRISAYRLLRPWESETATWLNSSFGETWGAAGADDTSTDRDPTPTDTIMFSSYEMRAELDVTSAAREWAADPGTNFGIVLTAASDVNVEVPFFSSEAVGGPIRDAFFEQMRPLLTVVYTDQPGTPVTVRYQNGAIVDGAEYLGQVGSWISAWDPDANKAGEAKLKVRTGAAYETLVAFDVQQAPVAFARLSVFTFCEPFLGRLFVKQEALQTAFPLDYYVWLIAYYFMGFRNPYTLRAFELERGWDAGTATWNLAAVDVPWAAEGALDASDRLTPEIGSTVVKWPLGWHSLDVTSAAQSWAEPGAQSSDARNAGLLLDAQGDTAVEHYFASGTYSNASKRPVLEVIYLVPTP